MPYKDPEKAKECRKRCYERNPEKYKAIQDKYKKSEKGKKTKHDYYLKHIEKNKERATLWNKNNPESAKKKQEKYRSSDKYIKTRTIYKWKTRGLVDDYDKVYQIYEYTLFCDECRCDLDQCTKSVKSMDHDHKTGLFRNILCRMCNWKRVD